MQVLKSQLYVEKFTEKIQHTFLDYLASGYELNFMVAVDFTGMFEFMQIYICNCSARLWLLVYNKNLKIGVG